MNTWIIQYLVLTVSEVEGMDYVGMRSELNTIGRDGSNHTFATPSQADMVDSWRTFVELFALKVISV
jgi:hypothetical protein